MTRGPDWLRADPGASTLAEIDMTAKRGMERPPARSTSARGRDSSVPRRGARTPRVSPTQSVHSTPVDIDLTDPR
jgi:hypothetical protein